MDESCIPVRLHSENYIPDNYDPDLNPLIFVHGMCDSCETWRNILEKVAEETKRKAYAIDLRNHGKSEWSECFSIESLCLDVENFMVKNGIKKTIFVSHSLGARMCMSICLRKPELVEKIVIEDTILQDLPPREIENFTAISHLMLGLNFFSKTMKEEDMRNFIAKRVKDLYPNNHDLIKLMYYLPGHKDAEGNFQVSFNLKAMIRSIQDKSVLTLDYTQFQAYFGPALIIYGAKSIMKPDSDDLFRKYFPNAEYHKVENCSHFVHKEYQKEFTTKVCEFLKS